MFLFRFSIFVICFLLALPSFANERLREAIRNGDLELVLRYLAEGDDPDDETDGHPTPKELALAQEDPKISETLSNYHPPLTAPLLHSIPRALAVVAISQFRASHSDTPHASRLMQAGAFSLIASLPVVLQTMVLIRLDRFARSSMLAVSKHFRDLVTSIRKPREYGGMGLLDLVPTVKVIDDHRGQDNQPKSVFCRTPVAYNGRLYIPHISTNRLSVFDVESLQSRAAVFFTGGDLTGPVFVGARMIVAHNDGVSILDEDAKVLTTLHVQETHPPIHLGGAFFEFDHRGDIRIREIPGVERYFHGCPIARNGLGHIFVARVRDDKTKIESAIEQGEPDIRINQRVSLIGHIRSMVASGKYLYAITQIPDSPRGFVFVIVDKGQDGLEVVSCLKVGYGPTHIALTGKFILVTHTRAPFISVIRRANLNIEGRISVPDICGAPLVVGTRMFVPTGSNVKVLDPWLLCVGK